MRSADRRSSGLAGLLIVLAFFCFPLFINLGGWDLRSDEAIYSYAVDRMVETGDWLTPRSIQVDGPFLEKPPLKFWMVAAAIKSGLVPHDEAGYRILDALMGAIAFVYIYVLGWRIAGPVCGVVAVLMTFSIRGLVYDHGLRSNNMEAPLLLAYCAGMYHFGRWVDDERPRLHAVAVGVAVAFGFMTKFVAVMFLPIVIAASVAAVPHVRERVVRRWRDWIPATLIALLMIAPWFVYETWAFGRYFWEVILGLHIVARFTGALDPAHLQPWHFYLTQLWRDVPRSQPALIFAAAGAVVGLWRGQPWQMRLVVLWFALPIALISLGTSKLFHYAYPFLPPVGLAAGFAAATLVDAARDRARGVRWPHLRASWLRTTLIVIAVGAIALAVASVVIGQVQVRIGGVRLLQNSTITRPLIVAAIAFALAGRLRLAAQTITLLVVALLLPVASYAQTAGLAATNDRRLRSVRDCASDVQRTHPAVATGVYNAARGHTHHAQYFYLSQIGPWEEPETVDPDVLRGRLFTEGTQSLVFVTLDDYERLRRLAMEGSIASLPPAVVIDDAALVLPGPYSACLSAARAAGAQSPSPR